MLQIEKNNLLVRPLVITTPERAYLTGAELKVMLSDISSRFKRQERGINQEWQVLEELIKIF